MKFERTNVFATNEEKTEIIRLLKIAHTTPVVYFTGNKSAADYAWEDLHKKIHEFALKHGLPDYEGYYGFDPTVKEFIKYSA